MIEVSIRDQLTPGNQRAITVLENRRGLMAVVGRRVENEHRNHFQAKEDSPNKRGWPKKHFWAEIKHATQLISVSEEEAVVAVSDPRLNPHLYGGRITPKRGRALAIPLTPEADAAGSPREGAFDEDELFVFKRKGKAKRGTGVFLARKEGRAVHLLYLLVPYVDIPKDEKAVPSQDTIEKAVGEEANAWVDNALRHMR